PWVVEVLCELLDALDTVHRAGLVHRDIKPSNILCAHRPHEHDPPRMKLVDFELAAFRPVLVGRDSETAPENFLGTAAYASPEQVQGEAWDARSDLYAVAVLGYELLAGRPP